MDYTPGLITDPDRERIEELDTPLIAELLLLMEDSTRQAEAQYRDRRGATAQIKGLLIRALAESGSPTVEAKGILFELHADGKGIRRTRLDRRGRGGG